MIEHKVIHPIDYIPSEEELWKKYDQYIYNNTSGFTWIKWKIYIAPPARVNSLRPAFIKRLPQLAVINTSAKRVFLLMTNQSQEKPINETK